MRLMKVVDGYEYWEDARGITYRMKCVDVEVLPEFRDFPKSIKRRRVLDHSDWDSAVKDVKRSIGSNDKLLSGKKSKKLIRLRKFKFKKENKYNVENSKLSDFMEDE